MSLLAFHYALIGGTLPALLWLWFFLREDRLHPEPKRLVFMSFLLGAVAIAVAVPLEFLTQCAGFLSTLPQYGFHTPWKTLTALCAAHPGPTPIVLWAAIEEVVKVAVIAACILWRKAVDEPIDLMVYLISIALGFAAFETTLFLLEPLARGDVMQTILTGNLRFIGAALVHTVASGVVGFALAVTFYRSLAVRGIALCTGLVIATSLHALFNHTILVRSGESAAPAFFAIWVAVVALFLLFERAKRIAH